MDIRDSFSRLKKKLKHPGSKRKPDRTRLDPGAGERVNPAGSLSRPTPHVTVGSGRNQGDSEVNTDGHQSCSKDESPPPGVPERVPAGESENDQEGGEANADGRYLPLHPDVGVAAGSVPGREGGGVDGEKIGQAYPSPPIPSIAHSGKPDGTRTWLSQLLPLIVPSDDVDTPTVPDRVPEIRSNESVEQSATADNNKSDWKSTTSATAKLLLRGVRDSADAFGPLKSVAGGLCFILDNCEVQPSYRMLHHTHNTYSFPSEQRQINKR